MIARAGPGPQATYLAALTFNPRVDLDGGSAVRQEHVLAGLLGLQGLLMIYLLKVCRSACTELPLVMHRWRRAASVARSRSLLGSPGGRGPAEPGVGARQVSFGKLTLVVKQAKAQVWASGVRESLTGVMRVGLLAGWRHGALDGQGAKLDCARELALALLACCTAF